MTVRIIEAESVECGWDAIFTNDTALAHGLNGIATELSVAQQILMSIALNAIRFRCHHSPGW
jgi:hypothetical protein